MSKADDSADNQGDSYRSRSNTLLTDLHCDIGFYPTLNLAQVYGGKTMYVPKKPTRKLVLLLGSEAAEKLCKDYGGLQWAIPSDPLNPKPGHPADIATMTGLGASTRLISIALGISQRRVQQIRKTLPQFVIDELVDRQLLREDEAVIRLLDAQVLADDISRFTGVSAVRLQELTKIYERLCREIAHKDK